MRLRIDTTAMSFMAAGIPAVAKNFETGAPREDKDGKPVYVVQLVAMDDEGAEVIPTKVSGEPKGISQGTPVKVTGLIATPYTIGERSGVPFRADSIVPATSARPAA